MQVNTATATPTSPVTPSRSIEASPLNFASDWRVVGEKPGEVTLVNIQDPVVGATQLRFAYSSIDDIFKNTSISAPGPESQGAPVTKAGVSLLIQATGVSTTDGSPGQQLFPWSAHLVLRVPTESSLGLSSDDGSVLQMLALVLGSLYETGDSTVNDRLDSLLHGALKPAGM